jgi:pectinesterase
MEEMMMTINRRMSIAVLCLSLSSVMSYPLSATPDITVAADGSGQYKKVQDAINAVPDNKTTRTVIYIKAGTYKEKIKLTSKKKMVTFLGESRDSTILTYDDYQNKVGSEDYQSVLIEAEDFIAENITFENTIDSRLAEYTTNGQAAAVKVTADRAIFYNCKITAFQDSYYLKTNTRTYVKNCVIDGTTDFIYGAGIALFENCTIRNRKNSHVTASNQTVNTNKYGFVFKNCTIVVYPGETVNNASLGRPWGNGARAVYLECAEGAHIRADGFAVWSTDTTNQYYNNYKTAYFAEYKCSGDGYKPASRLSWTHQLTDTEAALYTKDQIFAANTTTAITLNGDWNPDIGGPTSSRGVNRTSEQPELFRIISVSSGLAATINYEMYQTSHVRLVMYDLHGRVVATLYDGNVDAGSHVVSVLGSKLSRGVYFPRLSVKGGNNENHAVYTLKMISLR